MVPQLSALSLALYHEVLEGGENHKMETSIAKRNLTDGCHHMGRKKMVAIAYKPHK